MSRRFTDNPAPPVVPLQTMQRESIVPALTIAACTVFATACASGPSPSTEESTTNAESPAELSASGAPSHSASLPAGVIRGEFSWRDGPEQTGGHFGDALLIQRPQSELGLLYDIEGGQLFAHRAQWTTGVAVDGVGPGHHILRSNELHPLITLRADSVDVVEERGRARLRLTIAGRVALVSDGRFQSSAGDHVNYVDFDVEDGVDALRMEVLRGIAESGLVNGESAQVRRLDGAHWADYAGLAVERGFACLERHRATIEGTAVDIVELVVPRGAATLRLLLWHGFWRDQIPSIEESLLRSDAAKLPIDA
jgi:hypothetical protein